MYRKLQNICFKINFKNIYLWIMKGVLVYYLLMASLIYIDITLNVLKVLRNISTNWFQKKKENISTNLYWLITTFLFLFFYK